MNNKQELRRKSLRVTRSRAFSKKDPKGRFTITKLLAKESSKTKLKKSKDTNVSQTEVNSEDVRKKRRLTKRNAIAKSDMCKGGKWTEEEHQRFLDAMEMFGNIWKKVENYIGTRSTAQIRSHAQKHFRRLRTQVIAEMKKNNQLQQNVFVVVREYRNNTYNSMAPNGSLSSEASSQQPSSPIVQESNTASLEVLNEGAEKFDCEQEWRMADTQCCLSENGMIAYKDFDEKVSATNEMECLGEGKHEDEPYFCSTLFPLESRSQKLSVDNANFSLDEVREVFDEQTEERALQGLTKVKYEL
jgi:SHAQKYF class myb-like DNA-binding protein